MCLRASRIPIFRAFAPNPSLVEIAIATGRLFRRWDFAARVTEVSAMPLANLAIVFPVHGAMSNKSRQRFGPSGSTCGRLSRMSSPVISVIRCLCASAAPKRVSIAAVCSDRMGMTR